MVIKNSIRYNNSGNRIDDSFYGETENARNTILANDQWTYYTDRNGLGDIIQKSNQNEAHLFEYRGDKKLKKFTLLKNGAETQVDYYFDALGRRVAKDIKTSTETFTQTYAYEGDQDKILIGKSGSNQETLYVDGQGIDEHLAQVNSVEVKAYVSNHLGTILNSEATDQVKAIGAFGEQLQVSPVISSTSNPVIYGFTGRQLDDETGGVYYYRARVYDSESGKFLAIDPIGFNGGDYNIYIYAQNRFLSFTDPTGMAPPENIVPFDVAQNIEEAQNMTAYEFYEAVRSGGKWDFKRYDSRYEELGNYNFGLTGRAVGFSETTLKVGAGAYQVWSGTSNFRFAGTYFDDPRDQAWIQEGIKDFNTNYWNPRIDQPANSMMKKRSNYVCQ